MNKEQALQVLYRAVEMGQEKGAFTLADAGQIIVAMNVLQAKDEVPKDEIVPA